jgi:site-specific recombinase XerD
MQRTEPIVPSATLGSSLIDTLPKFRRYLVSENKAERTIETYTEAVRLLARFCGERGMPVHAEAVTREYVEAFVADQVERLRPASARARFLSLRAYFAWLVHDDYIDRNPMEKMHPPAIPETPVPVVGDDALRALLSTCEGRSQTFADKRDAAVLRLMIESGARLAEIAGLELDDVDGDHQLVRFKGKGSKIRLVPFGSKTGRALDRYLGVRTKHPQRFLPNLWLGKKGPWGRFGVTEMLRRRCTLAGLPPVHAHQLRHTAAHRVRAAGLDDDATMRLMGWTTREMLNRYGSSVADARMQDAVRRLNIGDTL